MAIIRKFNEAFLQGKLENFVFKQYEDKTVVCEKASSFKLSNSPAAVEGRGKFRVTAHLAKSISSLPDLKSIWNSVKEPRNTIYQTICKYNYNKSSASKPTVNNIITPTGFKLPVIDAAVDKAKVAASISPLNSIPVFTPQEVDISFNTIACFTDPVSPEDAPYELIACSKEIVGYDFGKAYELQIDFNSNQKSYAAKYSNCILYLCAATKAVDGNIVKYSATYAGLISDHL